MQHTVGAIKRTIKSNLATSAENYITYVENCIAS